MNANIDPDWKRLGKEIAIARVLQGYGTAKELAIAMGVTPRVIGDLENGRRDNYAASTKIKLEHVLGWGPGSIESILAGGEPLPTEEPAPVSSRLQAESERQASAQLELSKESTEELVQGIHQRVGELRRRVETADSLLAELADGGGKPAIPVTTQDDYDLVADDADGYDHEDEDEGLQTDP